MIKKQNYKIGFIYLYYKKYKYSDFLLKKTMILHFIKSIQSNCLPSLLRDKEF